jgi:hypothetical protein
MHMPKSLNVEKLMEHLGETGTLNLDTKIRDLMRPEGIGLVDPSDPVSDNAVAWNDYVLITKGSGAAVRELRTALDALRGTVNTRGPER